jgi:hypothetical protein
VANTLFTISEARPEDTPISLTAAEMVKLRTGATRVRLLVGGTLALLVAGGFLLWRTTRTGSDEGARPGVTAAGARTGPAPAAPRPGAGAPVKLDLSTVDLRAPDAASTADREKREPRRIPARARARPHRRPGDRPLPKGPPEDGEKQRTNSREEEGSKPYFDKL